MCGNDVLRQVFPESYKVPFGIHALMITIDQDSALLPCHFLFTDYGLPVPYNPDSNG